MSMKYMDKYVDTVMVQSDTELDETSTNPIQNKAVAEALKNFTPSGGGGGSIVKLWDTSDCKFATCVDYTNPSQLTCVGFKIGKLMYCRIYIPVKSKPTNDNVTGTWLVQIPYEFAPSATHGFLVALQQYGQLKETILSSICRRDQTTFEGSAYAGMGYDDKDYGGKFVTNYSTTPQAGGSWRVQGEFFWINEDEAEETAETT